MNYSLKKIQKKNVKNKKDLKNPKISDLFSNFYYIQKKFIKKKIDSKKNFIFHF